MTNQSTQVDFFRSFQIKLTMLECAMVAVVLLLARIILAQNLQHRLTPERKLVSPFWLVPVKDLLQMVILFCAFAGNTVEWRGRKMKLRRDGTLEYEK
jgi:ceramide glucosyltransferase